MSKENDVKENAQILAAPNFLSLASRFLSRRFTRFSPFYFSKIFALLLFIRINCIRISYIQSGRSSVIPADGPDVCVTR